MMHNHTGRFCFQPTWLYFYAAILNKSKHHCKLQSTPISAEIRPTNKHFWSFQFEFSRIQNKEHLNFENETTFSIVFLWKFWRNFGLEYCAIAWFWHWHLLWTFSSDILAQTMRIWYDNNNVLSKMIQILLVQYELDPIKTFQWELKCKFYFE